MRVESGFIFLTEPNEIFVFGSNMAGVHGAGAAKYARDNYGAKDGYGYGLYGQSYAIPTKDKNIQTLEIPRIIPYIQEFLNYAAAHPNLKFILTPIGCGLAGYKSDQMAHLFVAAPENIILPKEFEEIIG